MISDIKLHWRAFQFLNFLVLGFNYTALDVHVGMSLISISQMPHLLSDIRQGIQGGMLTLQAKATLLSEL